MLANLMSIGGSNDSAANESSPSEASRERRERRKKTAADRKEDGLGLGLDKGNTGGFSKPQPSPNPNSQGNIIGGGVSNGDGGMGKVRGSPSNRVMNKVAGGEGGLVVEENAAAAKVKVKEVGDRISRTNKGNEHGVIRERKEEGGVKFREQPTATIPAQSTMVEATAIIADNVSLNKSVSLADSKFQEEHINPETKNDYRTNPEVIGDDSSLAFRVAYELANKLLLKEHMAGIEAAEIKRIEDHEHEKKMLRTELDVSMRKADDKIREGRKKFGEYKLHSVSSSSAGGVVGNGVSSSVGPPLLTPRSSRKAKLYEMKRIAFAMTIQARWRGHLLRKYKEEIIAEKVAEMKNETPLPSAGVGSYKNPFTTISIGNMHELSVIVDFALALPTNITGVRMTMKLVNSSRQPVGAIPPPCFADLSSDLCNPVFSCKYNWSCKDVDFQSSPDLTLMCRLDTFERPSMKYKILGYASLKIFVCANGAQASSIADVSLNSGRFLVQLVQGFTPTTSPFSEALMQGSLRSITGAYLGVRVFDNVDKFMSGASNTVTPVSLMQELAVTSSPPPPDSKYKGIAYKYKISYLRPGESENIPNNNFANTMFEGSIASILLHSLPFATEQIKPILSTDVQRKFSAGKLSMTLEKDAAAIKTCLSELSTWLEETMPPPAEAKEFLSAQQMYRYNHSNDDVNGKVNLLSKMSPSGGGPEVQTRAKVGIEQLYNMPKLPTLPSPLLDTSRKIKYKTKIFKTYVRFIGKNSENSLQSKCYDFSSTVNAKSPHLFPSYPCENFKTCEDIALLPESCMLIEVAAIDVAVFVSRFASGAFDCKNDVYISSTPTHRWWGMIPLFINSSFCKAGNAKVTHLAFEGKNPYHENKQHDAFAFLNTGTHLVPLFEGAVPPALLTTQRPFKALSDILSTTPTDRVVKKNESTIQFSNGASAIVTISDLMLSTFTNPRLADNPFTPLDLSLLDRLSAAASRESSDLKEKLDAAFTYNSLLSEAFPSIAELLPCLDCNTTKDASKNAQDLFDRICKDFIYE